MGIFDIKEYDYYLPPKLIAQVPLKERDKSRLMILYKNKGEWEDRFFFELPLFVKEGDLIVVNNSRVIPARLYGRKTTGGKAELLVLSGEGNQRICLIKTKKPKKGTVIVFENGLKGIIEEVLEDGKVKVSFDYNSDLNEYLEKKGYVPVPPYIKREKDDPLYAIDKERYQTIFAKEKGSIAAPTAGLHFSEELIKKLREKKVEISYITLHVGYGTFKPVKTEDIRKHEIGEEYYQIPQKTAELINKTKEKGGRIIAVGTTVVRTLETVALEEGRIVPKKGFTNLLITPGFKFRVVDALITNFHLPKSSLLFLVAAFAGLDLIKKAYEHAIQKRYRFYSYGDAMFIQ
jgi:S-adenosylmethionine:tRNA ribosyltransferase-isomerase